MDTSENNNTSQGDAQENGNNHIGELKKTTQLSAMYEEWFLDYASYVILERAVPDLKDGLKPVQRRLLHAMKELDDGRYNKVANIIGHTMKYHPHGDASIGDALVQLGQKDLLIDMQGNWGNIFTGDSAAAPRYIEARLSPFALDVVFNPKTTRWRSSYDGRNKEPLTLPVKFPLLLAQGSEGIAVGLASKILPHNFNELIDACIKDLKGETFELYPDFPTAGMADFSKYNDGLRGGRIKVRAKISLRDKKSICITELPYGKTTTSLIESILTANDRGKIKIKKIEDNTAENVEIVVHLAPGISPDQTIDALYAFTDCEVSLNPNSCVIDENKPRFLSVSEQLRISNKNTLALLKLELEIKLKELLEQQFFSSLEKIFIEKRIYRKIEKCETWEAVIETIDEGLETYKKKLYREVTRDDIVKLTEIKIKRISKYDAFKADKLFKTLEEQIDKTKHDLNNLIPYAIGYYKSIKKKYGGGRERRTELRNFDVIEATKVAVANEKLYVNRSEGFAGTSLKKDEFVCECSDIDDIIAIKADGTFIVTKVANKVFLGKNILHIAVFNKNDERTIYNLCYFDGSKGRTMVKRCAIVGVQRDKDYSLIKGNKYSKILYLTVNPNGEAEVITVHLKPKPRLKKQVFDFDFSTLEIKGRNAGGNILSKNPVRKIVLKEEGISTLSAIDVWFDDTVKKLNNDERGFYLGSFSSDDKVIAFYKQGYYRITGYDITTHFDDDLLFVKKFAEEMPVSVMYYDNKAAAYYLKRFTPIYSEKNIEFINSDDSQTLLDLTCLDDVTVKMKFPASKRKEAFEALVAIDDFIDLKSYKAKGKRLTKVAPSKIEFIRPKDEYALPELTEEQQSETQENEESTIAKEKIDSTLTEEKPHSEEKVVEKEAPVVEKEDTIEKKAEPLEDKKEEIEEVTKETAKEIEKKKEETASSPKKKVKNTKKKSKPSKTEGTLDLFSGLEDS